MTNRMCNTVLQFGQEGCTWGIDFKMLSAHWYMCIGVSDSERVKTNGQVHNE